MKVDCTRNVPVTARSWPHVQSVLGVCGRGEHVILCFQLLRGEMRRVLKDCRGAEGIAGIVIESLVVSATHEDGAVWWVPPRREG